MSSILRAIDRSYEWVEKNGPAPMYWAIDIHGTILKPDYQNVGIATEFYPYAKETLQLLSLHPENKLIMFTSTRPETIEKYNEFFLENDIVFAWWNENPQVVTKPGGHGYFDEKFYFNILLDDKAGFNPDVDWLYVYKYLKKRLPEYKPLVFSSK